jgi:acyl-coenzyme A thioesterase PaaI-like protein
VFYSGPVSSGYQIDDASLADLEAEREVYGPFTQAVRQLVDVAIRTTASADEVRRAQEGIEEITARLRSGGLTGPYGVRFRTDGASRAWGNAVIGLRNAVAPPLVITKDERGVHSEFHLGAAYEGPPGSVHGGVLSLVLDQMLGQAAGAGGKPGMTATLTLTYRQRTPLGDLSSRAWIERAEDHKTWARGEISGPDGVTVEAEGLFILPRWARERMAESSEPSPRFFE